MASINAFWGVSLSLCAPLEHSCIHGKGILCFSPCLRRDSIINCFSRWNWKLSLSRLLLIPPSPPPRSLLLLHAVRERSGWTDGFKACDCSRESWVLFGDEIEGLYISFCHHWGCWPPPPLLLWAVLRTTFGSARPTSVLTDRREHEDNELVWLKSIQSVVSHEKNHSCTSIYKYHGILKFKIITTHLLPRVYNIHSPATLLGTPVQLLCNTNC